MGEVNNVKPFTENVLRSNVDGYGFERGQNFDHIVYDDFMSQYLSVLARRSARWREIVGRKSRIQRSAKVKRFCRKGIPSEHRSAVWMSVSGAEERMKKRPHLYRNLLNGQHDEHLIETINLDVHRTFPDNIYFTAADDPSGLRRPLYNVLLAVATNNDKTGYCQGMNFIAGMLLVVLRNEEKAFWLMDTLINVILPDFYSPDMIGARTEQEVFGEIVKWKCPEVYKHLMKLDVSWQLIGAKWFLCIYADVMPVETVLRIWDCLFFEGPKILLRVAVTLIMQTKDKILASRDFTEAVGFLQRIVSEKEIVNCHIFMKNCFTLPGSFPDRKIENWRKVCQRRIASDP
ncbi:hypothetical protein ScPMuIL_018575 [Solemya velum]